MGIWETGVLLAGIGFLILCIFIATTVRDLSISIKQINRLLDEKDQEIRALIDNAAGITGSVDSMVGSATKVIGVLAGAKAISGVLKKDKKDDKETEKIKTRRNR